MEFVVLHSSIIYLPANILDLHFWWCLTGVFFFCMKENLRYFCLFAELFVFSLCNNMEAHWTTHQKISLLIFMSPISELNISTAHQYLSMKLYLKLVWNMYYESHECFHDRHQLLSSDKAYIIQPIFSIFNVWKTVDFENWELDWFLLLFSWINYWEMIVINFQWYKYYWTFLSE